MHQETRFPMHSYLTLKIWGNEETLLDKAAKESFEEADRIDSILDVFNTTSLVWRLNNEGTLVSSELREILTKGLDVSKLTNGAFDPTILPLMELWGFMDSSSKTRTVPDSSLVLRTISAVDYRKVIIRGDTISLGKNSSDNSQLMLDLSGVAQGYAVDRIVDILKSMGIKKALIDMSGDIYCFGPKKGGWSIGIRNPRGDGLLGIVELDSGAIATSGDYENYFEAEGVRYHHIMDPATGYPVRNVVSSTVIAKTAIEADIWSTTLFVLGEKGLGLLDSMQSVQGMIVLENGKVLKTKGFPEIKKP